MSRLNGTAIDIYARVSRVGDDRQRSTEGQLADCRVRVVELGGRPGQEHVDQGRSAWNPRTRRLEWHRLMERLETGSAQGVIVFDLARFSRRPIEGERLIAVAERGVWVLDSEGEYDLTTASGKKAFRDQLTNAAYESDRLASRVSRGKRLKAMEGESNHSHRPWGFEADGVTPLESEAAELRRLVERLLAGEGLKPLVRDLNIRGVKTVAGLDWSEQALKMVLERPRNAGLASYRKEILGELKGGGKPIVSREQFDELRAMFAARPPGRPPSDTYLFSSLIHCGRCGETMNGRPTMTYYPDGERKREYRCLKRLDGNLRRCGGITAMQRDLDIHGTALILAILADPRHAAKVEEEARAVAAEREEVVAALARAEETAIALSARLAEEEMTLARYDAAIKPLDRRIAELRGRLDSLPARLHRPASEEEVQASLQEWEARWEASSLEQRRALIRRALAGRRLMVMPPGDWGGKRRRFQPERLAIVEG